MAKLEKQHPGRFEKLHNSPKNGINANADTNALRIKLFFLLNIYIHTNEDTKKFITRRPSGILFY